MASATRTHASFSSMAAAPLVTREGLARRSRNRPLRRVLEGQDVPSLFQRDDERDAAFNGAVADPEAVASAWAAWREEVR